MGSFWGSIHLRTSDRNAVEQLLEKLAAEHAAKFYLGPEINGWIAVYPYEHGQAAGIGEQLAQSSGVDTFHLILHDDDVFAYNFYRDGKLLDEYWSRPGYFSEGERAAQQAMAGDPSPYADLLKRPLPEVKALLERSDAPSAFFEAERFRKFAKALGLTNAATSYEYLDEADAEPVKFRRQFVHVPDKAPEKAAARRRNDALKEQLKRLKSQGILLADYRAGNRQAINWCPDARTGGFLLQFQDWASATAPLLQLTQPWPKRPPPFEIQFGKPILSFRLDPTGRFLAMVCGEQPGTALELWDLVEKRLTARVPDFGYHLTFSADGSHLSMATRSEVVALSTRTGAAVRTIAVESAPRTALHPSGQAMLIDRQVNLLLVPLPEGEPRTIFLGGKLDQSGFMAAMFQQLSRINPDVYEAQLRQEAEKALAKMTAMSKKGRRAGAPINEETIAQIRQGMEQQIQTMRQTLRRGVTPTAQAAERISDMQFTADGTLLLCATRGGMRAYEWRQLIEGDGAPRPRFTFSTPQEGAAMIPAMMIAVAEDSKRQRALFGGANGVLYFMDLSDGQVRSFLTMPDHEHIIQIMPSGDGSSVGCICRPQRPDDSRAADRLVLYIWRL